MKELLQILSTFSPVATIALSLVIIWKLIPTNKGVTNHLSNVPSVLNEIKESQARIEATLSKLNDTLIKIDTKIQ